jgi:hypothetical protein
MILRYLFLLALLLASLSASAAVPAVRDLAVFEDRHGAETIDSIVSAPAGRRKPPAGLVPAPCRPI